MKLTQDELLDEISLDLFGEPRRKGEFTIEEYLTRHGGSRNAVYARLESLVQKGRYAKRKALIDTRQRCVYCKLPNVGGSQEKPTKRKTKSGG